MRIHSVAIMALLTAAIGIGCDSAREVSDNGRANAYGCDQCHGYPPPPAFTEGAVHPVGVTASSCVLCHPSTVNEDGHTMPSPSTHRNGSVEVVADWRTPPCDACHGTPPNTGLHMFHWNKMLAADRATCATCHEGYVVGDAGTRTTNAELHMNGAVNVELAAPLPDGTTIPAANQPNGDWIDPQCLACHTALGIGTED